MLTLCRFILIALTQTPAPDLDQAMEVLESIEVKTLSIDYDREPLKNILDDLSKRTGTSVRADWVSLERLGVSPEDRVSLRFDVTRASTVPAALALSVGDDVERPIFECHAGQMVLTRVGATGPMRLTAVYDVRDLLADSSLLRRLHDEAPAIDVGDVAATTTTPGTVDGEEVEGSPPPADIPPRLPNDNSGKAADSPEGPDSNAIRTLSPGERLLLLITDHVDPEAWMNFGGNRALITELNGVIVVSATPTTHRRIRNALRSLRAITSTLVTIDAAIVELPRAVYEQLSRRYAGNVGSLASAFKTSTEAKVIWGANGPISIGEHLQTEVSNAAIAVSCSLRPELDRTTGVMRVTVDVATTQGDDRRRVSTVISLPGQERGISIELPFAGQSDDVRLLVLTVNR